MKDINNILDILGINIKILFPAFLGSLVGNINKPINIGKKLLLIFTGITCSVYITPLLCTLLNVTEAKYLSGMAFISGTLGLEIIKYILHKVFGYTGFDPLNTSSTENLSSIENVEENIETTKDNKEVDKNI